MESAAGSLEARLIALAAELALFRLPVVPDRVIPLAVDLLAADKGTPGTVAVASLAAGLTMREAEAPIRQMLAEQGIPLPAVDTGAERYTLAVRVFCKGGIGADEFSRWFYPRLPPWDEQTDNDKALAQLLDASERESDPHSRGLVEIRMREVAASSGD